MSNAAFVVAAFTVHLAPAAAESTPARDVDAAPTEAGVAAPTAADDAAPPVPDVATSSAAAAERLARIEATLAAREQREAGERRFRAEAITFGEELTAYATAGNGFMPATAGVGRRWVAFQGDTPRRRLAGPDFYVAIERPDLAESYHTRRRLGLFAFYGGIAAGFGGLYLIAGPGTDDEPRGLGAGADARREAAASNWRTVGTIVGAGGLIAMGVGLYVAMNPHPVDEGEAQRLAAAYNDKLRRKHGLTSRASNRAPGVALRTFAGPSSAGLVLAGRF